MAEMALPIKPHTRTAKRQCATTFSTEYHDVGQEPEAVITLKVSAITTCSKSENRIDIKTRTSAKMGSIFSTVKINMAAKPEVLILHYYYS